MDCINVADETVAAVAQMLTSLKEFNLQVSASRNISPAAKEKKKAKLKRLTFSIDLHLNIRRITSHPIESIFSSSSTTPHRAPEFFYSSLPLFGVFSLPLLLLYFFSFLLFSSDEMASTRASTCSFLRPIHISGHFQEASFFSKVLCFSNLSFTVTCDLPFLRTVSCASEEMSFNHVHTDA